MLLYMSSEICMKWYHICGLKLAIVGLFKKIETNTKYQEFFLRLLNIPTALMCDTLKLNLKWGNFQHKNTVVVF